MVVPCCHLNLWHVCPNVDAISFLRTRLHTTSGTKLDGIYIRIAVLSAPHFFLIWLVLHFSSHYISFHQSISPKVKAFTTYTLYFLHSIMVYKTASPTSMSASGHCPKSVTRTSGPIVPRRTVGQYSRTVYSNTVISIVLYEGTTGTVAVIVRVRVNSSVRRAGRDRVQVSNQNVVETGYAPSS
jgi:hypothetical protein